MRKLFALLALASGLVLALAGVAYANHVESYSVDCDGWSVSFAVFHTATDHDIVIHVDGTDYPVADFEGTHTETGSLPEGSADDGEVTISADWTHNGEPRSFGPETVEVDCASPSPSPTPTPTHTGYPPSPHGCHADSSCHTRTTPPPTDVAFTGPGHDIAMAGFFGLLLALVGGAALLRAKSSEG